MTSRIDKLLIAFENAAREPWGGSLSGLEKVWFLVYDPKDQRKIDLQMDDFELRAKNAGRGWTEISLKNVFPTWMAAHEYKEEYFAHPGALVDQLESEFKEYAIDWVVREIQAAGSDPNAFVALTGVSALFGFCRLADILQGASDGISGRALVFFPGEFSSEQYRLLDARDGWNYLARPIIA